MCYFLATSLTAVGPHPAKPKLLCPVERLLESLFNLGTGGLANVFQRSKIPCLLALFGHSTHPFPRSYHVVSSDNLVSQSSSLFKKLL